ncbi:hypothetical protein ABCV59_002016 [Escherichia coli]
MLFAAILERFGSGVEDNLAWLLIVELGPVYLADCAGDRFSFVVSSKDPPGWFAVHQQTDAAWM